MVGDPIGIRPSRRREFAPAITRTCRAPGSGRPVSTREARTGQAKPWWVPRRPHWHPGRNAGRHESPKGRGRGDNDQALPHGQVAAQLAASQISAATRIAKKNTTTMTAAGIVRSLRSCLCTSVPLAVDGARARRGRQAWSRCAGGFSFPGQRLQLPNLRLFDPALRPEPSGKRSPATAPVRPVVPRGEAGWVLVSVACCPAGLLVVGSEPPWHGTRARRRRGSRAVSQGDRPPGLRGRRYLIGCPRA